MKKPLLYAILDSFGVLTPEQMSSILLLFKPKSCEKGKILLDIGEINDNLFFIETGITREFSFIDQEQGQDSSITHWIMAEGNFQYIVNSFLDETPSEVGIEVIEKAKIWCLNKKALDKLYQDYPQFNFIGRLMGEFYLKKYENYISILRKPAERRLEWFDEYHKGLVNRVPLRYIASYLNITPTHLSRIRRAATKKHQ